MIIIAIIISIFFIVVIVMLCRSYTKDIFELENRVLQLEKRINECETFKKCWNSLFDNANELNGLIIGDNYFVRKESDTMACGRRGRPRGSHNTTHGGRKK